jgi:serine/threonine protein kinase
MEPNHPEPTRTADAGPRNDTGSAPDTLSTGPDGDSAAFLAPPKKPDEIGRLGPYRVLGVIGRGGMGAVYRAEDPALKRQVALKIMLPAAAAHPEAKARFIREARAQAAVEHDHVIPIFQVDETTPFIVMPLLKGQTLAAALRQNPRPPVAEVLRIGREIAEGLAAAHDVGLVHRDIKPANVWLEGNRRRVKLLDFGLARAATAAEAAQSRDEPLTALGTIVGTPAYMSPEQAQGQPVDHRTDLFSLGVILYQMATGQMPFAGSNSLAVLTALVTTDPLPPLALAPDLPPSLSDLILHLLAKDPARRLPTAHVAIEELRQIELALGQTMVVVPIDPVPGSVPDVWSEIDTTAPEEVVRRSAAEIRSIRLTRPLGGGAKLLWLWAVAGLVLLVAAGVVAWQVVRVTTPKGTLVIESTDPDAEVIVKGEGVTLRTKDRELLLKVGDYTIELAEPKSGLKLSTDRFEIRKDDKSWVRVTLEKVPAGKERTSGTIDLLALVVPARDTVSGRWKLDAGKLVGGDIDMPPDTTEGQKLQIPFTSPAEYDLTILVERTRIKTPAPPQSRAFALICPGSGPFQVVLDYEENNQILNGIQMIRGAHLRSNETKTVADFFGSKKGPIRVDCRVRRNEIAVLVDGREQFRWTGDRAELSLPEPWWKYPSRTRLGLGVQNAEYRIHEWRLTPVGAASPDASPDRRAAEYVLSIGGSVGVNGEEKDIRAKGELPKERFALTSVVLRDNTQVTDAGLAVFKECKNLTQLTLWGTNVSDEGLDSFKDCNKLTLLLLQGTRVTDKGLAYFKDCKTLSALSIEGTQVGDLGLASFKDCKQLIYLGLRSTKITAPAIALFAKAHPQCKIDWDGGVIQPRKNPDREAAEWVLLIGGKVMIRQNGRIEIFTAANPLPPGPWPLVGIDVQQKPQVNDAALARFQGCTALEHVDVRNNPITDAGAAHFKNCKNLRWLSFSHTKVTDAVLPLFKGCPQLALFGLADTQVTDAGLAHLSEYKNLTALALGLTPVSDAALKHLDHLSGLILLNLMGTKVTREGFERMRASLPECRIDWGQETCYPARKTDPNRRLAELVLRNGGSIDVTVGTSTAAGVRALDQIPARPFRLTTISLSRATPIDNWSLAIIIDYVRELDSLQRLELDGHPLADAELEKLATRPLPHLDVRRTQVTDAGLVHLAKLELDLLDLQETAITDQGLTHLAAIPTLRTLYLKKAKVTETGVKKLAGALPQCRIEWDGGVIEPKTK